MPASANHGLPLDALLAQQRPTVLLAASEAAAARYREQVLAYQQDQADAYLEQVQVLPLAQWLVSLWDASFPSAQVLRPVQLLALARQLIEASGLLPDTVLNSLAIARRFVDAFDTAERYRLPSPPPAQPEWQAFAQWRAELQTQLAEQGALSAAQLPQALTEALQAGALELPELLVLTEELELCPAEQALLQACAEAGVTLSALAEEPAAPGERRRHAADTVAAEVDAAACWAAALLRDAGERPPRIGLVAVDMASYEAPLRRALARHVYPYALFPAAGDVPAGEGYPVEPWVSGGGRLADYPVIASALDLLQLPGGPVPLEQLSRVLRSPFVSDAEPRRGERAELDWYWREQLPGRVSLREALYRARRHTGAAGADFLQRLQEAAGQHGGRELPSTWVRRFDAELLASGWPNREPGDPVVDQCRRGFSQVMDTLRAMDRQLGAVNRGGALFWLQHILQGKRFELRREAPPPLVLLSLDEAQGQHFDQLWLLGLSDASLPRPPEPSPFLPREACREAEVPRVDAADCLRRDRAALQALLASAPSLVLSCPEHSADGVEQGRCALLDWDCPPLEQGDWRPGFALAGELSWPASDTVRAVSAAERERLRGGSGLFRDFAASPLLAFLKYRLGIRPFPQPVEGLDPATQGAWVHAALELFWQQVKDSQGLAALGQGELEALLADCIERATASGGHCGEELLRIERRRLQGLLRQWLAFERERSEAFVVEATEQAGRCDAFGIPLQLRVDRIDRIGDARLIIDYKTGLVQANKLNADKLLEPQLPLYALFAEALLGDASSGGEVDGVALAQVNARYGMSVHLRSNWAAHWQDGKKVRNPVDSPDKWRAELQAWSGVLRGYAEGFLGGCIDHDYSLGADAFPYDPYVTALARAAELSDEEGAES